MSSKPTFGKFDLKKLHSVSATKKINLQKIIEKKKSEVEALESDDGAKRINIIKSVWREKPVSPEEFIFGKNFINATEGEIYPKLIENLNVFFSGEDYMPIAEIILWSAGFGAGKSTGAALAESYFFYWNTCLKNCKNFYGHKQSTLYAFMNIAPSEEQAKKIVFSEIQNNIMSCDWFANSGYEIDENIASKIKFKNSRDIEIIPASSSKKFTTGYNLLFCEIDECAADDCFITKEEDLFFDIFQKVNVRRNSRFRYAPCKGLIICTTTAGTEDRYFEKLLFDVESRYAEKYPDKTTEEMNKIKWNTPIDTPDGKVLIRRDPVWRVNPKYKEEIDKGEVFTITISRTNRKGNKIIYELNDVPKSLEHEYQIDGAKFQRNQAAIPCTAISRFFGDIIKNRFNPNRQDPLPNPLDNMTGKLMPFYPDDAWNVLSNEFKGDRNLTYYVHGDLSKTHDHVGLCIGHRGGNVSIDNVIYPTVVIDLCVSFVSDGKREIKISSVKEFILRLRNERNFIFSKITFDQYQSLQTLQDFTTHGMLAEKVSCTKASFIALKELWYSDPCRLDIFYDNQLWWEIERLEDKGRIVEKSIGATDDEVECLARVVEESLAGETPVVTKPRVASGIVGTGRYVRPTGYSI